MSVDRRAARQGVVDALPLFVPAIPFGLVIGLAITEARMNPLVGWSSSWLIFAGAAQLTLISLIGSGAAVAAAIGTALVVNARHLMYSVALAPTFQRQPRWFRWLGPYLLIDQVFALVTIRPEEKPDRFRSYGSMTADGVRALLRLGAPPDDPRVVRAAAWLDAHFDPAQNPGDFPPVAEVRRASAYYYWTWTAAHAMRALGRRDWASPLAAELLRRQLPDGSWKNPASEMREDDPVVATSFAVAALGVCRMVLAGEHRSHAVRP